MNENVLMNSNEKVAEAVAFATVAHSYQVRKGTDRPYITHPLEVLTILSGMRADNNLLIAGVLHDTIEDTNVTREDIAQRFGEDVASLVDHHSENKALSWQERKQHCIDEVAGGSRRLKMLILADKLSNIRDMCTDYRDIGDKLWERFNAPKDAQAWYNSGIIDALEEFQYDPQLKDYYREMKECYRFLFENEMEE